MKLAGRKSALTPLHPASLVVYSTDCSKAVVPLLVCLTLCCLMVYSTRRFVLCLTLCYFVFDAPVSVVKRRG